MVADSNPPLETAERLEKAGYRLVGRSRRGAVKICTYTKRALLGKGGCYKQKFYGIASHRCLQMAPDIFSCNHRCVFCWRDPRAMGEKPLSSEETESIFEESLAAQRTLLIGFKGNPKVSPRLFEQSIEPNQVAISLAGEPTLYKHLGKMISKYRRNNSTTFLVTNGTRPSALKNLSPLPTQLYVTLPAPDEETYRKTAVPVEKNLWKKILQTLRLLPKLRCRKVIRLTLVKGWNFSSPEKYASLISLARPHYVEVKSYVNVGYSTARLSQEEMLSIEEIREFSRRIAEESGYIVTDEFSESRVVLLSRDRRAIKGRIIKGRR